MLNPGDAKAHCNLGIFIRMYLSEKNYNEAEKELREAIRINPDLAEAHTYLGMVLEYFEKFNEAAQEYKTALILDKGYEKAYLRLCHLKKHELQKK